MGVVTNAIAGLLLTTNLASPVWAPFCTNPTPWLPSMISTSVQPITTRVSSG